MHQGLQLLDFTGDGITDIIVCGRQRLGFVVSKGIDGAGALAFALPQFLAPPGQPLDKDAFAVGSLRGNGMLDLVVASEAARTVAVFGGYGSLAFPGFAPPVLLAAPGPRSLALGDLDGDGRLDIVTANPSDDSVTVLLNPAL